MIIKYSCFFRHETDTAYYGTESGICQGFLHKKRTPKARNAFFHQKGNLFLTERLEFLFFLQLQEIHAAFKVGFGVFSSSL